MFTLLGPGGNTTSSANGVFLRATRNADGHVQLALSRDGEEVVAEAWGPGAAAELEVVPRLLGLDDDPGLFVPPPGQIRELARANRGLRLGSTGRVFEALVPAILGQRDSGCRRRPSGWQHSNTKNFIATVSNGVGP